METFDQGSYQRNEGISGIWGIAERVKASSLKIQNFLPPLLPALPADLTVLPQTQEVVRDVRNDVAAVEVQDAGAEVGLALQGLQPPLFQLGVVAVEVDMADEISRIVQRTKATLLPKAGEFFLCRKDFRKKSLILSKAQLSFHLWHLAASQKARLRPNNYQFIQQIPVFNHH